MTFRQKEENVIAETWSLCHWRISISRQFITHTRYCHQI